MNTKMTICETDSFYKNISLIEVRPFSETSAFYDRGSSGSPKNPPTPSYESSFTENQPKHTSAPSYSELSDDIQLLKQTIIHLIKNLNKKSKEKLKKKEKLKFIENSCVENNEKMKKIQKKLLNHEEKIIELERKLSFPESSPVPVADHRPSPRILIYDKPFFPKAGLKNINLTISTTRTGLSSLYDRKSVSPVVKK